MGHKGHYGEYSGNAKWSKDHADTKVTEGNYKATKKDDEAHMEYLKKDIDYDNKHGYSDSSMTSDEKHISKLAGDLKYDEKKHGSPAKMTSPFNQEAKYFGLGKDDGTGRKIKKANKTLKQISKMQTKRSSVKDVYLGDPDDKTTDKVRTADKPASKRETRKIKKYKKTKEQLGNKIAKSPLPN